MIIVADTTAGFLHVGNRSIKCSIGRSGAIEAALKREGDGATPLGRWPVRGVLLRPDRVCAPDTKLPWRWLRPDDGWSDGIADPAYNGPVRHPHAHSAERLWREDGLYDVIVVLGHNDSPPVAGAGSAIFLHCWRDGATTEGCVAVERDALVALVSEFQPADLMEIV